MFHNYFRIFKLIDFFLIKFCNLSSLSLSRYLGLKMDCDMGLKVFVFYFIFIFKLVIWELKLISVVLKYVWKRCNLQYNESFFCNTSTILNYSRLIRFAVTDEENFILKQNFFERPYCWVYEKIIRVKKVSKLRVVLKKSFVGIWFKRKKFWKIKK